MIETQLTISNKFGLHARAAAKLASTAKGFHCAIRAGKDGKLVDAKSVMALMLLAASQGTVLQFQFDGSDERGAHQAVSALFGSALGEPE